MGEEGSIRRATAGGLEEVLTVINTTNRLFYMGIVPTERFRDSFMSDEELKEEFGHKAFYVCELGGRIVGVAAFEPSTTRSGLVGVMTRICVLPRFQKSGIGMALISDIENEARRWSIKEILIWTDPKARWVISFYRKAGYGEVDPATRYGDEAIDARMEEHGKGLLVLRKAL